MPNSARERMSDFRRKKKRKVLNIIAGTKIVVWVKEVETGRAFLKLPPFDPSCLKVATAEYQKDLDEGRSVLGNTDVNREGLAQCFIGWLQARGPGILVDWMNGICDDFGGVHVANCVRVVEGDRLKPAEFPLKKGETICLNDVSMLFGYLLGVCMERNLMPCNVHFTTVNSVCRGIGLCGGMRGFAERASLDLKNGVMFPCYWKGMVTGFSWYHLLTEMVGRVRYYPPCSTVKCLLDGWRWGDSLASFVPPRAKVAAAGCWQQVGVSGSKYLQKMLDRYQYMDGSCLRYLMPEEKMFLLEICCCKLQVRITDMERTKVVSLVRSDGGPENWMVTSDEMCPSGCEVEVEPLLEDVIDFRYVFLVRKLNVYKYEMLCRWKLSDDCFGKPEVAEAVQKNEKLGRLRFCEKAMPLIVDALMPMGRQPYVVCCVDVSVLSFPSGKGKFGEMVWIKSVGVLPFSESGMTEYKCSINTIMNLCDGAYGFVEKHVGREGNEPSVYWPC